MQIEVMDTTWKRVRGAMFRDSLKDRILVFPYPHARKSLFHTFFCPPLQVAGLDSNGRVRFSRTALPNQIIRLPNAQFILESERGMPADQMATAVLAQYSDLAKLVPCRACSHTDWNWNINSELLQDIQKQWNAQLDDPLFCTIFPILADAVRKLNSVTTQVEQHGRTKEDIVQNSTLGARGKILVAAHSIIYIASLNDEVNHKENAPWMKVAVHLRRRAEQIHRVISKFWNPAEVHAAGEAALDWPKQRKPSAVCIKCQGGCTWSRVLHPAPTVPYEATWRYDRPENHVPICAKYACGGSNKWAHNRQLRIDVARIIWGARFEALLRWHDAARRNALPSSWNRVDYLLWPKAYGGEAWKTGSGHYSHIDIYSPNHIPRTPAQREKLAACLNMSLDELPHPLVSFPSTVADFWSADPDDA